MIGILSILLLSMCMFCNGMHMNNHYGQIDHDDKGRINAYETDDENWLNAGTIEFMFYNTVTEHNNLLVQDPYVVPFVYLTIGLVYSSHKLYKVCLPAIKNYSQSFYASAESDTSLFDNAKMRDYLLP